jgi:hypothetical protein
MTVNSAARESAMQSAVLGAARTDTKDTLTLVSLAIARFQVSSDF